MKRCKTLKPECQNFKRQTFRTTVERRGQ